MLTCSNTTNNGTTSNLNDTFIEEDKCHLVGGCLTIALSWLPPVVMFIQMKPCFWRDTYLRTSYQSDKTSFKPGLEYVLKGPTKNPYKLKGHWGVTQKPPFSWFAIVGLVFRIFYNLSFISKQKSQVLYFHWKLNACKGFLKRATKKQLLQPHFID